MDIFECDKNNDIKSVDLISSLNSASLKYHVATSYILGVPFNICSETFTVHWFDNIIFHVAPF